MRGSRGFDDAPYVMIPADLKASLKNSRICLWPAWQIERCETRVEQPDAKPLSVFNNLILFEIRCAVGVEA